MVKFCFKKSLGFIFVLSLSITSLLASPSNTEDEDSRSIHSARYIEDLPDELHMFIFSFLTPKDAPSVTRVSSRWQRLMDDNQLWKGYARRAQILLKEDLCPGRNYKAFVRDHCTFSFTDLGFLNGGSESIALGVSSDGSVIVGEAKDGAAQNQQRAFRWTPEKGMESVEKVLTEKGLLSAQWRLTNVNAITPTGTVMIGEGIYNDGRTKPLTRAWRAVIPRRNLF